MPTLSSSRMLNLACASIAGLGLSAGLLTACAPAPTVIEDNSAAMTWSGPWSPGSSSAHSGGTDHYSTTTGASTTFRFTGSQFRLYGVKAPYHGIASVKIDGAAAATFDAYAPTWTARSLLFTSASLLPASHTVTVTVLGTKRSASSGTGISIDKAEYDAAASPATITGTTPTLRAGSIEESVLSTTRGFTFSGDWVSSSGASVSGGTDRYTTTAGSSYTLSFTGSSFSLVGTKAPYHGYASLSIDGAAAVTVNNYASAWLAQQPLYTSPALPQALHHVKVTALGTGPAESTGTAIAIDRADVTESTSAGTTSVPPASTPPVSTPPPAATRLPGQVFAPSSFWYQRLPANAPLAANSAAVASNALRQMHQYYGSADRTNVAINTTSYAAPVYIAGPNDPKVNVGFNDCQGKGYFDSGLRNQFTGVPIPANAQPADGTDSEMVIYSPTEDRIWELWVTKKVGNTWSACWGGRLDNASNSPGIFPGQYGTTATGLPFMGGQITVNELTTGQINHAIGIAFVETRAGTVSWPAQRTDGWVNDTTAPAEGQRLRIDPTLNIDALNLNPTARAIAKAGQTYGFVVWDKAGAVTLRAENPKPLTLNGKTNPYPNLFAPAADWNVLDGIPWNKLQALPYDYGRS